MGHKVHPTGFRLGVVKSWQSRWYAERDYKNLFAEDFKLRKVINQKLADAAISRIEIERAAANQVSVTIHTAKPGIVIGRSGAKVDELRAQLEALTRKRVRLNIVEIRQPELDAFLVGRSIAEQLEKRVSFRRAMKQAVQKSMRANAKGIRVIISGRLGGAEIARSEKEIEGKIPLHTLRADIDYGLAEAHTTFGVIGIKVWIYKGDILPEKRREPGEVVREPAFAPQREERGERRGGARGERGPRAPRGERTSRPPRGERPQGERTQGERAPRPPRGERPQGERSPRASRPTGERPARPPRGEKAAQSPETQSSEATSEVVPATPSVEQTQAPETNVEARQAPEAQQAPQAPVEQASEAPTTDASESE